MRLLSPASPVAAPLAVAASLIAAAGPARASYIVTFTQAGADVVASGGDTIDTNGLTLDETGGDSPQVGPSVSAEATGAAGTVNAYQAVSGPSSFGPGGLTNATSGAGDLVGIDVSLGVRGFLYAPTGYVSGASLSDTATYASQTFASLGLTPGSYVYSFGSGANADTFTINVGAPVSAPEPASLAVFAGGVAGLLAQRRRRTG